METKGSSTKCFIKGAGGRCVVKRSDETTGGLARMRLRQSRCASIRKSRSQISKAKTYQGSIGAGFSLEMLFQIQMQEKR